MTDKLTELAAYVVKQREAAEQAYREAIDDDDYNYPTVRYEQGRKHAYYDVTRWLSDHGLTTNADVTPVRTAGLERLVGLAEEAAEVRAMEGRPIHFHNENGTIGTRHVRSARDVMTEMAKVINALAAEARPVTPLATED